MEQRTAIRRFEVHIIERPVTSRLNTSYGEGPATRPHVIVEIEADGLTGWGEASPLPEFTGETAEGIALVLRRVYLPGIVGRNPLEIAALVADLARLLPRNSSAKAAVDIALHDLAGKLTGQPVYRLLGGPCRAEIELARVIGILPVPRAVDLACAYAAAGFRTVKLKVGREPREDVVRVRAIRQALGPEVALRVDANQGYDLQTAIWVLRRLEECELQYVEQPLPAADLESLRILRRHISVPIMADEGVHTPADALCLATERLVDVFAIKLIKTGGLWQARKVAAIAEAAGIACVVVSPFETQVGAAAGLHLAVSLEHAPYAHELTVFVTQPELATTSIITDGSRVRPPDKPGLGVARIAELAAANPP